MTAYEAGASGSGAKIAIIDTGVDTASHEFSGRIDSASSDVAGRRSVIGEDDHGTAVARVAAAGKDERDVQGIAYGATIVALRADTPGSCTAAPAAGETEAGCSFEDRNIALGVDRAVTAGARVINLSLGGADGIGSTLRAAIMRAASAGIVIVVSAGNEYNDANPSFDVNSPSPFALEIVAAAGGLAIVATSVDQNGAISNFSNRAGTAQASTLSALGEGICCAYEDDTIKTFQENGRSFVNVYNGTSFSAPQISGAVALLAQAFPNLTGREIVSLLLSSARDAGDAGTDGIYGTGILDIARAFAPRGQTTLAGSSTTIALGEASGIASPAMGDGGQRERVEAVILDQYSRAYQVDLAAGVRSAPVVPRLTNALTGTGHSLAIAVGPATMQLSLASDDRRSVDGAAELALNPADARQAQVLAGRIAARVAPGTAVSFGIREDAHGQAMALAGARSPAFLIAREAGSEIGLAPRPDRSFALRQNIGDFALTVSGESGRALIYALNQAEAAFRPIDRRGYALSGVSIDRAFGPLRIGAGASLLDEDDTVLGARLSTALAVGGARSRFADVHGDLALGSGWVAAAAYRRGWTDVAGGGGRLSSSAFSVDLSREALLRADDSFALRVSQPLRVDSGGLSLNLPVAYDYASGTATYGIRTLSLTPSGRELAAEAAYSLYIPGGSLSTNAYLRRQPNHIAAASVDVGAAVRLNLGF